MNDRFKFRVWDGIMYRYDCQVGVGNRVYEEDGDLIYTADGKCVIEQCTGLKDRNGNLIYEGDIVRHSYSGKRIVRFGKYTGCFACGWENIYVDLFGWYLDDYYEPDDCGRLRINPDDSHDSITEEDASDLEIIGNIHEQSEQKDMK